MASGCPLCCFHPPASPAWPRSAKVALFLISRLRLTYWVAQVCNADTRDYCRVAQDGGGAGKVVEEWHSGAKQHRCDVDADFVEEARIQQLLDGVRAVDPGGRCDPRQ